MRHLNQIALCAALVSATFLSGCLATSAGSTNVIKPRVIASRDKAEVLLSSRGATTPDRASSNPVTFSNESWISMRKVERTERDREQAKTDAISVEINQRFASLNEVAGAISSYTGLPVSLDPDVKQSTNSSAGAAAPMPFGMPPGAPTPAPSPFPGAPGQLGQIPVGPITTYSPFIVNYSGSLTGFMNQVSAYYGIFWKVEDAGLRFFQMESRTFRIAALPGDTRLASNVESTSSSSGSGGGASNSSSTQAGSSVNSTGVNFSGLSVWSAIESGIKQMLSAGGKVIASPATGTVTVTDTPVVMQRVSEFVKAQNLGLNRQVSVNVRVLSVEVSDGEDYGINWDAVYSNLKAINPYSLAVKTAFPSAVGAGNLIISAPTSSTSRWAGSSAIISALSSQGRVSELTSSTIVTLNNQPSPVNVGRKVTYLASSTSTQTANVGSTVTLTPGTVQTGFSMTLIPHILDSKELMLQYSLDLSSLLRLSNITSGGATIQGPDIASSNFLQRVRMMSGETLVVAGFDQDNLSAVASGVGSPDNTAMGSRIGSSKRSMLVVLIQPLIAP